MTGTYALIPAAGRGARFNSSCEGSPNKVYTNLAGRAILRRTVDIFDAHSGIDGIVVIAGPDELELARSILSGCNAVKGVVAGGVTRQESVFRGLAALRDLGAERVLVHDGARPLVTHEIIDRCLGALDTHPNAVAAVPLTDTLKRSNSQNDVVETLSRDSLWLIQTPQAFILSTLIEAHTRAQKASFFGTDDASLIEEFCAERVHLILGSNENIKVTVAADMAMAEAILGKRMGPQSTRIGTGYDIHRLVEGRKLFLGGIELPNPEGVGLDGHSDADVLLHAICDALLGAAGQPDIGHLFPNDDKTWKDARSTDLLRLVNERVTGVGFAIVNIDATVIAESPRIAPHIPRMRSVIAEVLGLAEDRIGIKATTNEGIGALGKGVGIAAHAVAGVIQSA